MRWRRSPSAAPRAVGGGAGAGAGGRGVGRANASESPAPEPSLGLASHVNLERLVSALLQHCKRGGVLVIAELRQKWNRPPARKTTLELE
jgi:hypothetical protein